MSTRTQAVHDELRRELLDLSGQFEPGQRLKLLPLAERFDASLSVVREALTRLAEQGLVVATPQHGFSVREGPWPTSRTSPGCGSRSSRRASAGDPER
ncbi:MAG TPA: GntR family transcriptional regulator, partial [Candidatus Dormibacteraeota bacterium]